MGGSRNLASRGQLLRIKFMKVCFWGTSEHCLVVLEALHKNFDLRLVVTRPDKLVGRKKILTPSAPKIWAQKNNILLSTPATLKKGTPDRLALIKLLNSLNLDLAVISDYGLIIPQGIFNLPHLGIINVHFSKLPDLRGPSPVQFTLLRGDTIAWITIFKVENPPELDIKMDSGPILSQKSYPIFPNETAGELYPRLFQQAAYELPKLIQQLATKNLPLVPQDHSQATYCHLLTRDSGFVKWEDRQKPATYNIFRAMSPWPGLWTLFPSKERPRRMKILQCHLEKNKLVLDQIQFEGKKRQQFYHKLISSFTTRAFNPPG